MPDDAPYSLLAELDAVKDLAHPPIHLWNPDLVKDIDMEIRRDGTWYYMGTPIKRQRLVRLFSTVLRREDDGEFYLVTPVEKCRIKVEDAPFVAILMRREGEGRAQRLVFTTNTADEVVASSANPITLNLTSASAEPSPYVLVRDGLDALISRSVYYQLVDMLESHVIDGDEWQGVWSEEAFFPFIRTSQLN